MLICASVILPVMFVAKMTHPWAAVVLIGLGAAGHQAWSANVYTLVSDVFPKKATASVVGIAGMVGTFVITSYSIHYTKLYDIRLIM